MDVIIQTSNCIYIIECKLDGGAEEAMQQIEAKNQQLLSLWISELYYQSRHQLLQQDQRSRELIGGINYNKKTQLLIFNIISNIIIT